MSTGQANLQIAISANGKIKALLAQREEDIYARLAETRQLLDDLIDNLEDDFVR